MGLKAQLLLTLAGFSAASHAAELGPIVYSSWGELCAVDPAQAGKPRCADLKLESDSPAWSPDGRTLAVEAGEHDGASRLYLLDRSGAHMRALKESDHFMRPVWSPDGKFVFGLGPELRRWSADGKVFDVVPVSGADGARLQMLSFSPSGKRAAVLVDDFKQMLIVRVTDFGLEVTARRPDGFAYVSQSVWLDDSRLIFIGKRDSNRGEMWELNVDTGAVERVGVPGLWLRDSLALSPDRKAVVVCAVADVDRQHDWNLWRYSLDSKELMRLTHGSEDVGPSWRP